MDTADRWQSCVTRRSSKWQPRKLRRNREGGMDTMYEIRRAGEGQGKAGRVRLVSDENHPFS